MGPVAARAGAALSWVGFADPGLHSRATKLKPDSGGALDTASVPDSAGDGPDLMASAPGVTDFESPELSRLTFGPGVGIWTGMLSSLELPAPLERCVPWGAALLSSLVLALVYGALWVICSGFRTFQNTYTAFWPPTGFAGSFLECPFIVWDDVGLEADVLV
ncbi:hypothetical protein DFJ74DRAFT_448996 [Hyaloraphidium curvatum]|nr:hypothetical protein DFJ74DRAFT_448996 [Hyaloraphidium curvatum]